MLLAEKWSHHAGERQLQEHPPSFVLGLAGGSARVGSVKHVSRPSRKACLAIGMLLLSVL
jgi:hypothetical protein